MVSQMGKDILAIEGMRFDVCHGIYEIEKSVSQVFMVDIYLGMNQNQEDVYELKNVINYVELYQLISKLIRVPDLLIETLTKRIVINVLQDFPLVLDCKVRVSKMPQLGGVMSRVYFEHIGYRKI
ncbi:MAG TPA: dihydroneopterin aldolase [Saprospiraceae bacterium]|nr:dihydroneopterin aldolase [Saprospiraceae bacterium]